VYDVVFHPDVLTRCAHPKFKDMVIDTAIDGVCSNFKVELDRESKKLPKMKFKGTPSSSVIRKRVSEVRAFSAGFIV
jgi:dynein assembly factor 2